VINFSDDEYKRGGNCGIFELGSGSGSAHCLKFNEPWFSSYSVSAPFLSYNITMSVAVPDEIGVYSRNNLVIDNSNPLAFIEDVMILAELIGDLMPAQ